MNTIGKNIEYSIENGKLIIKIDMSKNFGPSASGKSMVVASTEGNKKIGDIMVGVNAYRKI